MLQSFREYIKQHALCQSHEQVMLAVSGGVDSVVMTDLFYKAGYDCMILHCNFKLRATESDGDEAFVRSLAASYELPVFVKAFNTEEYAGDEGISIQMAARKLRYEWFTEIAREHEIKSLATAHNMNDSTETFLINLSRGSGIRGLTGIPVRNGIFIRPMLEFTRQEILVYAKENSLQYREDSSNASKKYSRNKIRHDVIPSLEEINPQFVQTTHENIARISDAHVIFREYVEKIRSELFITLPTHLEAEVGQLLKLNPLSTWIYELFSSYGFSRDQCSGIEQLLYSDSGKQCISTSHRIYKDREKLLLFESEDEGFEKYYIDSAGSRVSLPFPMDMELSDVESIDKIPDDRNVACLDFGKLNFPLIIRKWQHGDYFFPLGMDQMKKLSDFFIDEKIPVPVKNQTWIMASGKHIVWIMGLRIDNRYKITSSTREVLRLRIYGE